MTTLDPYDEAVWAETFPLADAVRRFLTRASTQRLIRYGFLDQDVTEALIEADQRMSIARAERIAAARGEQMRFDG